MPSRAGSTRSIPRRSIPASRSATAARSAASSKRRKRWCGIWRSPASWCWWRWRARCSSTTPPAAPPRPSSSPPLRSIPLLVFPLFTGVAATFALSRAVIHYLNPNSAFLGSIIIGNGINGGIILLARYLEERRRGTETEHALRLSLRATWVATFAASAAAAASYGSLGAVSFRGFNQFAFMGCFGMLICWVTTYGLMPAFIALQDRYWPFRELGTKKRPVGWIAGPFAQLVVKRPVLPVVLTTL